MATFALFLPESPTLWVFIIGVIVLLFGGSRLPQLAKALGQSKRAFKDGLSESEQEEQKQTRKEIQPGTVLTNVDDETLFEEARRREAIKASEKKQ